MENLIPALPDALAPGKRKAFFDMASGFGPANYLHLLADVAGHLAGSVLPVLGQCLSRETPTSPAYALVAYVPVSQTQQLAYGERSAARFEVGQHAERWFEGVQMFFTEIDITDYAECLALECGAPTSAAAVCSPTLLRSAA
jgi:hypothetical protein